MKIVLILCWLFPGIWLSGTTSTPFLTPTPDRQEEHLAGGSENHAKPYFDRGIQYVQNYQYDSAYVQFEKCYQLSEDLNDTYLISRSLYHMALIQIKYSKGRTAISTLQQVEKYPADAEYLARIHMQLGSAYTLVHQYDSALYWLTKSMRVMEISRDMLHLHQLYNDMAILYLQMQELDKCKVYLDKARKSKDPNTLLSVYNNLGRYYEAVPGGLDSAIWYYKACLDRIRHDPARDEYLTSHINMGIIFFKKGDIHRAIEYNRNVLKSQLLNHYKLEHASALANMSIYHTQLNMEDSVHKYFMLAMPIAQANNFLDVQKNLYDNVAYLMFQKEDFRSAMQFHLRADSIAALLMNVNKQKEIAALEAQLISDATLRENDLLKRQNKLDEENIRKSRLLHILGVFFSLLMIGYIIFGVYTRRVQDRLNINLKAQKKDLEELNQTKNKLFSIISHDLRGPVGSTYSLLHLINENYDRLEEDGIKEKLQVLEGNALNVYQLVSNLLDWSKLQRKTILAYNETIYPEDLWYQLRGQLQSAAGPKHIHLAFSNTLDSELESDPNILKTILSNLAFNAIKFSNKNSEVRIECLPHPDKGTCFKVIDEGIGMPEELSQNLFNIKHKTHREGTLNEQGAGLGLIIVKELTEVLKGSIEVHSEENVGTEVTLILP